MAGVRLGNKIAIMNIEEIRVSMEIAGYAAGVASVLFLAFQIRKDRKLNEYKMLQTLEEKYTSLLWKAADHGEINNVWKGIPENRNNIFQSIIVNDDQGSWPIWEAMTEKEKNCYRFSRSGLEILEQAYIAKRKGWVDDAEIWSKWEGWMKSWKTTNSFVPYVMLEMDHWFSPSFIKYFNAIK
jgi:hypothetical protein